MGHARRAPAGQPPVPEPPRKGIEVGLLPFVASIVGVLLVLGVIGGVLWFTREGEDPIATTHTDPTQPAGALTGTPTLSVTVDEHVLVYTFDYEGLREGDYFVIRTGPTPEQVDGAPINIREGKEFRQGLSAGQQECGTVQVVRGTQRSGWSQVQCERVGS